MMVQRKMIGQLIKENHWSVKGLADSLKITKEDIIKWEKLNKRYKNLKKKLTRLSRTQKI